MKGVPKRNKEKNTSQQTTIGGGQTYNNCLWWEKGVDVVVAAQPSGGGGGRQGQIKRQKKWKGRKKVNLGALTEDWSERGLVHAIPSKRVLAGRGVKEALKCGGLGEWGLEGSWAWEVGGRGKIRNFSSSVRTNVAGSLCRKRTR